MRRHKLSKKFSKRNFKRTASRVNRKNLPRRVYRGGFRL